MSSTLRDLATTQGASQLVSAVAGSPALVERLRALAAREIARRPQSADIKIKAAPGMNNAGYNFADNSITTGLADPDVLGHELGHAHRLQNAPMYQKLMTAVNGLSALNHSVQVPLMLGLRLFTTQAKRHDIERTLAGISAALAAPRLLEEASASADAVRNSDDKLQTAKRTLPALGQHALHDLMPSALYHLDQRH